MTGLQLAMDMCPSGVRIFTAPRNWYEPEPRIIWLTMHTRSGADSLSLAEAAHEAGHAIQHHDNHICWLVWRHWLIQSRLFPILAGLVALWFGAWWCIMALLLVALSRIGATVWIEFDASRIALEWMDRNGLLTGEAVKHLQRLSRTYL